MKKNYFLLLVTMLLGFISLGQTVSIGTSGTTTNQAIPIEPYYGYSWGQSIYPASELTTAGMIGVRQIDTITFEYTSATLNNSNGWVVYLANSTKSTFSSGTNWEPLSSFTEVFNGTATVTVVSGGNNLVKIALSTPYYWDGTSNLIVGVDENAPGYGSSSDDFYCRSVTGVRSIVYRNDGTNPNPASPPLATYQRSYVPNLRISHSAAPACFQPVSLSVNNFAGTSATIHWASSPLGTTLSYQYKLGASGTVISTSIDSANLTGLSPLTNYDFYVRSICSATDTSNWSTQSFNTGCTAGLAGTYTINASVPTFGTNFNTFADAISLLNSCGVDAPVVFNVLAGTYTGEVLIGNINGASATNTITFDGGTSGATLTNNTSTFANGTVRFLNASYTSFMNLNINTVTGYGRVVYFDGNNNNITIKKCNITTRVGTSSSYCGIYNESGTGSMSNFITIDSNTITNGYYSIYWYGGSSSTALSGKENGNSITNNNLNNFYYYGIYNYYQANSLIEGNTITSSSTSGTVSGIRDYYCLSSKIRKNIITVDGSFTNYGIYFYRNYGTTSNKSEVINNTIVTTAKASTSSHYGLYMYYGFHNNIYHNTVLVRSGGTSSTAYYMSGTTSSSQGQNNVQNNIFINEGNGYGFYSANSGAVSSSFLTSLDYNVYNVANGNLFRYSTTNHTSFASYQTAALAGTNEVNSLFGDPGFISSPTNLHLQGTLASNVGNNAVGVTTDIDGDTRPLAPATTVDIGADEYFVPTCPTGSALAGFNAFGTTHDVTWTPGASDISWILEHGALGFTPGTGTSTASANDTATITGLMPKTDYHVYVRGICGSGDTSIFLGPLNIRTGCFSQLSGTYTLDPTLPASLSNYVTMADWMNDLTDCGVGGPTVLNVSATSGPHIMGQDLSGINGISSTNTVTMNGNGTVVNRGTGNYFLALNGISHLTINDFMFINETPGTAVYGIMLRGGCDSVSITNNTINVGTTNSYSHSCITASNSLTSSTSYGNNANNLTIDGNTLIGGYYGIRLNGTNSSTFATGNVISNNTVKDFYNYGIYSYYGGDMNIHNNDINRATRTSITTFYGIYARYGSNIKITNNKIHDAGNGSYTAYPIYFANSSNSLGNESYLVNNAIYNMGVNGTGTFYGMYIVSTVTYIKVLNNTIQKNTDGSNGTHRGFYLSSTPNNAEFTNNLVTITGSGTGTKYCYYSNSSSTWTGGNNLFHMDATAGTNYISRFSANHTTIAAWSTATSSTGNSDANPSILAGSYTPLNISADNLGTPLVTVPLDIDLVARSATTPDVGAVEFVGLPGDVSIQDAWLEEVDACYGTADSAYATIKHDFGGGAINFATNPMTVNWSTTGPLSDAGSLLINTGTLAIGASMNFYVATIDMSAAGTYTVSANISSNAVNLSASNDTLTNHSTFDKKRMITTVPDTALFSTLGDSVKLSTQSPFFPGGSFFMTEISQYRTGTGSPTTGWPSYFSSDDYMEITGVPGSDMVGLTMEFWTGTSISASYTFPAGTIVGPNGTLIFGHGNGSSSAANFYYGMSPSWSSGSGSASGRVLKDASGNIMDAVVYYNYSFPASSGVTASDWTGNQPYTGSTSGIRLQGADVNSPTNWVASATSPQNPNVLNTGVILPAPSSLAGLQWTDLTTSTLLDTTPEIYVKGFTANGYYPFEASFVTPCGTYKDTSVVQVLLRTLDTVAPVVACDTFFTPLGGQAVTTSGYPTDTIFGTNPVYDSIIVYYPLTVKESTSIAYGVLICDSLVSPSGKVWTASGIYFDTIPNFVGCDSVINVYLTITTTQYIPAATFACDSILWRGMTLTAAGMYSDTILTLSCDSIFTMDLTMGYATFESFTHFVCDSFVSPTGKVWKTDGTYMDTIMNASGCDSNMTFNLTFGYISYASYTRTRCDSYTSPSGKIWTTSGTYLDTIVNASGCDSAMTFNLTVNYSYSRTDNIALCPGKSYRVGPSLYTTAGTYTNVFSTTLGCDSTIITNLSYYAPAVATVNYNFCTGDSIMIVGNWYYAATTFMDTIVRGSSNGCDSVTTHNLTTRTVSPALNLGADVVSCVDGGVTVYASTAYDTYNWSTGGTTNVLIVNGALTGVGTTNHILTVTQASSGCTATDDINVTFNSCVGLNEVDADLNVNIYPNPANNFVTIEIFDKYNEGNLKLEILNSIGQVVSSRNISSSNEKVIMDVNNFSKGMYLVRISSDKLYMTKKLIIQK